MSVARRVDVVLVNPGDRRLAYQGLAEDYAAVEPPYWVAVLAADLRRRGFAVAALDAAGEGLSPGETAARVRDLEPLLAAVIVYGSHPSASTQNMTAAGRICRAIREGTGARVALGGLHPSALPRRTMEEEAVDFVIQGEGFLTLPALLSLLRSGGADHASVPGLWYRRGGEIASAPAAAPVRELDEVLRAGAWDLLPMRGYRAHTWHCFDDLDRRAPYGAVYTSLGCPYSCLFCCINAPFGGPGIRHRGADAVVDEIGLLVERHGVRNLKIIDELFVFDERRYLPLLDRLIARGYDLNAWAYARVDTVRPEHLERLRRAGITWLALGIESASPAVRDGATKRMRARDVGAVVRRIREAGIRVIGNYIFGLPDDTPETMRETLDLAVELNCEFANFYCAMAYPGSKLYELALAEGWELPATWDGYSQLSYETLPLPTRHVGAREVLRFRDEAFTRYFTGERYLAMLERTFSPRVRDYVVRMAGRRLHRRVLGDPPPGGSVP